MLQYPKPIKNELHGQKSVFFFSERCSSPCIMFMQKTSLTVWCLCRKASAARARPGAHGSRHVWCILHAAAITMYMYTTRPTLATYQPNALLLSSFWANTQHFRAQYSSSISFDQNLVNRYIYDHKWDVAFYTEISNRESTKSEKHMLKSQADHTIFTASKTQNLEQKPLHDAHETYPCQTPYLHCASHDMIRRASKATGKNRWGAPCTWWPYSPYDK
jgi:hypothetical protein